MRDSNVANAAKESTQREFSHGLLEFRVRPEQALSCNRLVGRSRKGQEGAANSELGFCGMSGKSGRQSWRPDERRFGLASYRGLVWAWHSSSDVRLTRANLVCSDGSLGLLDRLKGVARALASGGRCGSRVARLLLWLMKTLRL